MFATLSAVTNILIVILYHTFFDGVTNEPNGVKKEVE